MTLRLIHSEPAKQVTNPRMGGKVELRSAKVYRDTDWSEYRVRFYRDGDHLLLADYHTDDKADALGTAAHSVAADFPESYRTAATKA